VAHAGTADKTTHGDPDAGCSAHEECEGVRGNACSTGVAAGGDHRGVFAVLSGGLRHPSCPDLLHGLSVDPRDLGPLKATHYRVAIKVVGPPAWPRGKPQGFRSDERRSRVAPPPNSRLLRQVRGVKKPRTVIVKPPPASPVQVTRFLRPRAVSKKTCVPVASVNARYLVTRMLDESTTNAWWLRFVTVPGLTTKLVPSLHVRVVGSWMLWLGSAEAAAA